MNKLLCNVLLFMTRLFAFFIFSQPLGSVWNVLSMRHIVGDKCLSKVMIPVETNCFFLVSVFFSEFPITFASKTSKDLSINKNILMLFYFIYSDFSADGNFFVFIHIVSTCHQNSPTIEAIRYYSSFMSMARFTKSLIFHLTHT